MVVGFHEFGAGQLGDRWCKLAAFCAIAVWGLMNVLLQPDSLQLLPFSGDLGFFAAVQGFGHLDQQFPQHLSNPERETL